MTRKHDNWEEEGGGEGGKQQILKWLRFLLINIILYKSNSESRYRKWKGLMGGNEWENCVKKKNNSNQQNVISHHFTKKTLNNWFKFDSFSYLFGFPYQHSLLHSPPPLKIRVKRIILTCFNWEEVRLV